MVTSLGTGRSKGTRGSRVEFQAVLPLTPLSGQEQRALGCGVRGAAGGGVGVEGAVERLEFSPGPET